MTQIKSRRRKERAQVFQRLKGVYLDCPSLSQKLLRVMNVSELGIGIEMTPFSHVLIPGEKMEARLIVGLTKAPIQIRFVHFRPAQNPKVAGFEFVDIPQIVQDAVRSFFEPELAGASLRPVASPHSGLKYADENSNTIEIWKSAENKLERVSFTVLGNQVEWDHKTKLVTVVQNGTKTPVSDYFRKQLLQLIECSSVLEAPHKAKIANILRFTDTED